MNVYILTFVVSRRHEGAPAVDGEVLTRIFPTGTPIPLRPRHLLDTLHMMTCYSHYLIRQPRLAGYEHNYMLFLILSTVCLPLGHLQDMD
jgi:hypothetical protein